MTPTHPRECDPALALCPCRAGLRLAEVERENAALRRALNDAQRRLQASRDEVAMLRAAESRAAD